LQGERKEERKGEKETTVTHTRHLCRIKK